MRCWALTGIALACAASIAVHPSPPPWGFYAHREINRYATFTLTGKLAGWYKRNVAYVTAHAIDPDRRRYAAPLEGRRHFIDLERFGDGRVASLPATFWEFHARYTTLYCLRDGDSLVVQYTGDSLRLGGQTARVWPEAYGQFYRSAVMPAYYQERAEVDTLLPALAPDSAVFGCQALFVVDTMTEHGVLPYHLAAAQRDLTSAFARRDLPRALQLSAELGHYVGDATVPLHTTVNYNGELTGQRGIHAFWESRLPELFAEERFDPLVGPAAYVYDVPALIRKLITDSHTHVDSVLLIEADLRRALPEELQDCYEERLGRITRVPCTAFARAYLERLDGMVEERFRAAIAATGSLWYTAWVDGGMPALGKAALASGGADSVGAYRPGPEGRGH